MVKKLAIIYLRVSSEEQKSKGYSLPTQFTSCMSYAAKNDFLVVGVFQDAHTGTELRRPEFDQALSMPSIDSILVHSLDRLARVDPLEVWNLLSELKGREVTVHAANYGEIKVNSFMDMMIPLMMSEFARQENVQRNERISRGRIGKVQSGKVLAPSATKYGYKRQNAEIVIDENEAKVVRDVFHWFCYPDPTTGRRMGSSLIAQRLTSLRIPTRNDGSRRHKGSNYGVWSVSTITDMLRSELYAGKWYFGKTKGGRHEKRVKLPHDQWLAVDVPPIISRELWEKAQEQLQTNKKTSDRNVRHEYLAGGRLRCATCGLAMIGSTMTRGNKTYSYYVCKGTSKAYSKDGQTTTCHGTVEAGALDRAIWKAVENALKDPRAIIASIEDRRAKQLSNLLPDQRQLERYQDELAKTNHALGMLLDLYLDGRLPKAMLDDRQSTLARCQRGLTEKITILERKFATVESETIDPEAVERFCTDIQRNLETLTFEQRRLVMDKLNVTGVVDWTDPKRALLRCLAKYRMSRSWQKLTTQQRSGHSNAILSSR